jgi:tRNA(Ile)-lysidine synthase
MLAPLSGGGVYNGGVLRQVAQTIAKYGMLKPGERVGVAVSGGADSVALLHILRDLADELGISLSVAHLNHKMRGPESDADERFVAALAATCGLRYFTDAIDVRSEAAKASENVEQAGRKYRYQWFTRLLREGHADKIAVGHTQTDQAETVLYRLLRGSGSAGLAGIRPVLSTGIVRPLITVSRGQLLGYLRESGREWREDASNRSMDFARNRIRHELMPQLTQEWNPNIEAVLAHTATWALEEEDYWRLRTAELAAAHLEERGDGVYLRVSGMKWLPAAAQKRLLRLAIEKVRGDLRGMEYDHVQALAGLITSRRGTGHLDLPGTSVSRSFDWVRLAKTNHEPAPEAEYSLDVAGPGVYEVPGQAVCLEFTLSEGSGQKPGYNDKWRGGLDWDLLPKPLKLRSWRPGDRYQPLGCSEEKKLKSLFQREKVAVWDRVGWPVLCAIGATVEEDQQTSQPRIVWARGFGPAADFICGEQTQKVLEITEIGPSERRDFS